MATSAGVVQHCRLSNDVLFVTSVSCAQSRLFIMYFGFEQSQCRGPSGPCSHMQGRRC